MKKLLVILFSFLTIQSVCAQIRSKVDERFELTSIMFALAGAPEYCQCDLPSYKKDIVKYLAQYDQTVPINFIRELAQNHKIGYDAVSTTAEMLEIKNGKIRLQPQYKLSMISEFDSRWTPELFNRYLLMVNDFYKESHFRKFFNDHRELYYKAQLCMDSTLNQVSNQWFRAFYGRELDDNKINVFVSLTNGPNNYALKEGVLIGMRSDEQGQPNTQDDQTIYMLIHEFSHLYINPIFNDLWPKIESSAERMYPFVEPLVRQHGYRSAQIVFAEWLVNLASLMYMKENDHPLYTWQIRKNIDNGFIWMQRSIDFMDNFYACRDIYPNFESFMPQLIAFIHFTADHYDEVITEYSNRKPYITNIFPAIGSDILNADKIIITFSEPMLGAWGFNAAGDSQMEDLYIDDVSWSKDYRKVFLTLDREKAKENSLYGIEMAPDMFISARYFWLDEKYKFLYFKTTEK